jgi:cysteine dioxygenase
MSIKDLDKLIDELTLNLDDSINILSSYDSRELLKYYPNDEEFNNHKNTYGYYKKLIHNNDKFELYLIFWFPYASSPIHDHPEQGCVLKLLSGELIEEVFINNNNIIKFDHRNIISINDINNRYGNKILHKIINLDSFSVSLHLYYPPKFKQNIFKI